LNNLGLNLMDEEIPMELTDAQWEVLTPPLPVRKSGPGRKGRPARENRETLEGIFWVLRTGARWKDLPKVFPPYQTCHRRFGEWVDDGTFEKVLKSLAEDLLRRGKLDLSETFIDGTFASAKKGAVMLVKQSAAKGPRSWQLRSALVFLSPSGQQALRRMNPSLSRSRSTRASPRPSPSA
jgi:transposase